MSQTTVMDFVVVDELPARSRIAVLLNRGLFGSLVLLLCLAPIPYGTSHPWWKALFIFLILAATIVAVIESLLAGSTRIEGRTILFPIGAMIVFAFLQTIPLSGNNADPALPIPIWNAVSADPYQTRFVALQLLALGLALALLYRYASSERRIRVLIHLIIGVAVVSAIFGILRQTIQTQPGFILPVLRPGAGYGQFVNRNHFGFMMEMAFGLGLGLVLGGGIKRKHAMVYVAMLLPIWTALVLANSRGAILAMIAQLAVAGLLITRIKKNSYEADSPLLRASRSIVLRLSLILVLILGAVLGAIWVGGDRLISSFETVSGELTPETTIARDGVTRNEIWRASLRMFLAHPILGVGMGGYWIAITAHHQASGTMTPQEAHNEYLELLASGGIVGFAIGVWFAVAVFRQARKNLNTLSTDSRFHRAAWFGAAVGITGVAFHSLFDFGLHMMANASTLVVLLMIVTNYTSANDQQETN
jgi:O-antigen ligase